MLLSVFGHFEHCCCEHVYVGFYVDMFSVLLGRYLGMESVPYVAHWSIMNNFMPPKIRQFR